MKSIENGIAQVLTSATGINVTAEFVNVCGGYFFIEWKGNDEKTKNTIFKCLGKSAKGYDYDDEFGYSSCYATI
jgi:hypothetical protein